MLTGNKTEKECPFLMFYRYIMRIFDTNSQTQLTKYMKQRIPCLKNRFLTAYFRVFLLEFLSKLPGWSKHNFECFLEDKINVSLAKIAIKNAEFALLRLRQNRAPCLPRQAREKLANQKHRNAGATGGPESVQFLFSSQCDRISPGISVQYCE